MKLFGDCCCQRSLVARTAGSGYTVRGCILEAHGLCGVEGSDGLESCRASVRGGATESYPESTLMKDKNGGGVRRKVKGRAMSLQHWKRRSPYLIPGALCRGG